MFKLFSMAQYDNEKVLRNQGIGLGLSISK
jgi:hypothetical protein